MGGGGGSVPRGGRRRRERGPCVAVGHAGRPAVAPGRWMRLAALLREQGRTAERYDSVRERLTGGAGQQRGPVAAVGCGRE
jgi:hypothetical protein